MSGSSLAISILEEFFNKGLLTISTTHYSEIKNYALVHDGFINASFEFDLNNLKPTYKLLIGLPGKSNAFAISKKLGLNQAIIDRANSFITSENISIEELLKNIYDDKILIEKEKEDIEKNLKQAELLRKSFESKNATISAKEASIIEQAKIEARKILQSAKNQVSDTLQEINTIYKNCDSSYIKNLNNTRNKLNEAIKQTNTTTQIESKDTTSINKNDIYVGMQVLVKNLNQHGVVASLVNKQNEVLVQVGSFKMMVNLNNITKSNIDKKENITQNSTSKLSYSTNKTRTATSEINVIGYNVEEAIFVIDKYLDDCTLAKLSTIRIVHGKGTGTLRKAIHSFLKVHTHVKGFRLGNFGEGEMGVTIVELK